MKTRLMKRLARDYPLASAAQLEKQAEVLLRVPDDLRINVVEYALDKPLSDLWVHDLYCIRTVMAWRKDGFVPSILALARYEQDEKTEAELFPIRR